MAKEEALKVQTFSAKCCDHPRETVVSNSGLHSLGAWVSAVAKYVIEQRPWGDKKPKLYADMLGNILEVAVAQLFRDVKVLVKSRVGYNPICG